MKTSLYVLHLGPTVLGAYSTPSRLTEAVADWHNEFMRRFERLPEQVELPRMTFVEVDKGIWCMLQKRLRRDDVCQD